MTRFVVGMSLVVSLGFGAGCRCDSVEDAGPAARNEVSAEREGESRASGGAEPVMGRGQDDAHPPGGGHGHDEIDLGTAMIGDLKVALAQGHGVVEPGKEGHLVVKLPYSDKGATTVRAWLGTQDRTLSFVGKGQYAASHDDYDVHAVAPDPLPPSVMWWVEIEAPDGTRRVGSIGPRLE